jgi:hypothetical protein
MKKKLYYTVNKEVKSDRKTLNGIKTIAVYEIVNNKPEKFFDVECLNEDNSHEADLDDDDYQEVIQDYLSDNGYGDDEFELILL